MREISVSWTDAQQARSLLSGPVMSGRSCRLAFAGTLLWHLGCVGTEVDGVDGDSCGGGKCDELTDVRSQLDGLNEPIATWLRESSMTKEGIIETNYLAAIEQIGKRMNCPLDSLKTFVLSDDLVMGQPFPRLISTLCSDDETRAADFFVAASFQDPKNRADVDTRNLEMFAWDDTAKRYVFYAALPVPGSPTKVQIEVEPRRCAGCHLNSSSLDDDHMPMTPIMNELTSPWPHWNAEPDFPSHSLVITDETKAAPHFSELTRGNRLGAAVQFEQLIRAGHANRVVAARLRERRDPADVGKAMGLLRPLYCDEQINYITEDHGSNVLATSGVIAGGIREAYLAIKPTDWPWQWLNDGKLRFEENASDPLAMIPVRGNADIQFETRMMAVNAIAPMDVLRIRALDWKRPVLSDFRCQLWKSALARLREKPPEITPAMRNVDLFPLLYKEIMRFEGKSLIRPNSDELIAIADGNDPDVRQIVDIMKLGNLLQAHADQSAKAGGRDKLRAIRDDRLCVVDDEFPNRPALPEFSCRHLKPLASFKESAEVGSGHSENESKTATAISRAILEIPDAAASGISSKLEVDDDMLLGFVTVRVAIDHGWRGDLALTLRTPTGIEMPIIAFDSGDSADGVDGLFEVPTEVNEAPAGTWTLTVIDRATGEEGLLLGWSLGINTLPPSLELEGARLPPNN